MRSLETSFFTDAVVQMVSSTRELLSEFRNSSNKQVSEHFMNGVGSVVDAIEAFFNNRIENVKKFSGDERFKAEQQRFYSQICIQLLINIHQNYLPLLYASKENNEYLILPSIDRVIHWFHADVELTLLPDSKFNYTYNGGLESFVDRTVDSLEKYLDASSKGIVRAAVTNKIPRWTTFIHFPLAHRDSALNLVIIIHEVGHLIDQTCELYKKFLPITLDKSSFTKEIEDICTRPLPAQQSASGPQLTFESVWGRAAIEANFTRQCIATVESWVREIIADCFAIRIAGPAYLFSFSQLMAHAEGDPSDSHPAAAYRISLLLEELRNLGYMEEKARLSAMLVDFATKIATEVPTIQYRNVHLVAQKTLEKLIPRIQTELRSAVSGNEYKAAQYDSEVPEVLELLLGGIAPIELRIKGSGDVEPAAVTSIINAGWELYKTRIAEFYSLFKEKVPDNIRLKSLNDLIFKAVEASEVVRAWKRNPP